MLYEGYGFRLRKALFHQEPEALCRTLIDLILLDQLSQAPNSGVRTFEEYLSERAAPNSSTLRDIRTLQLGGELGPSTSRPPPNSAGGQPTIAGVKSEQPPWMAPKLCAFTDWPMELEVNGCVCTGRADYAIGYSPEGRTLEAFFVIVGVKKGETLVMYDAMAQTLFYLGEYYDLLNP